MILLLPISPFNPKEYEFFYGCLDSNEFLGIILGTQLCITFFCLGRLNLRMNFDIPMVLFVGKGQKYIVTIFIYNNFLLWFFLNDQYQYVNY
jgi:predicted small integral membrane protein